MPKDHPSNSCPECGSPLPFSGDCEEYFHQMLFMENERVENGAVHHLAVLCYYLQHPSRYSPDGLRFARGLLVEFIEKGTTPQEIRRRYKKEVSSTRRNWKVSARKGAGASYERQPQWTMTAADVVSAGIDRYLESVSAWAATVLHAIQESELGKE